MFGSFEITSIRLYTPLHNTLRGIDGVYNLIEVISSIKINLRESFKCNICNDDIVEDLHHFLFECKTYVVSDKNYSKK